MTVGQRVLFIVSAPSGAGKTTLVERLVEIVPDVVMSRSYTSRPARPDEIDGLDYNFVSDEEFDTMVESGGFLEWVTIFDHRYGTSALDIEQHERDGRDVVLVIDVQGARQVKEKRADSRSIFVLPPSFSVLEERLRGRSAKHATNEQIRRRLQRARQEVSACSDYQYVVVNDDVDACVEEMRCIVVAERARMSVMRGQAEDIGTTFSSE